LNQPGEIIVTTKKIVILGICILITQLSSFRSVYAQSAPPSGGSVAASGPRRQLATIIFAGLGGAILGLSTLSFYGRPQDHLSNIAIGFGLGIIGGTLYMTYQAATNPRRFYGDATKPTPPIDSQSNQFRTIMSVVDMDARYKERVPSSLSFFNWSESF
jgi:hypothetical protein